MQLALCPHKQTKQTSIGLSFQSLSDWWCCLCNHERQENQQGGRSCPSDQGHSWSGPHRGRGGPRLVESESYTIWETLFKRKIQNYKQNETQGLEEAHPRKGPESYVPSASQGIHPRYNLIRSRRWCVFVSWGCRDKAPQTRWIHLLSHRSGS